MDANLVKRNENGKPVTNSLLVAEKFEKRHSDVVRSIENMLEKANAKLRSLFVLDSYIDEQGKLRPLYYMNRDGFSLLAMGFTGEKALNFKLEFIEAFNQLEQRATSSLSAADIAIKLVESASRTLNLNDSSKLLMYQRIAEAYSISPKIFPDYTASKGILVPLTAILQGTGIGTRNANIVLEGLGVLEKRWRRSSNGKEKSFWSISPSYAHLGENQVSPQNPKETQPLWLESRREELVQLIHINSNVTKKALYLQKTMP